MILGMTPFTLFHVVLSLIGIGSGLVVMFGLLSDKLLKGWTGLFLSTTVATSVTGFGFKVDHFMPSHAIGIISLVVLAASLPEYSATALSPWLNTTAHPPGPGLIEQPPSV